jgi:glycosyltransferase involved in cell wall biosynthesis
VSSDPVNPAVEAVSVFFPCYNDEASIGEMVRIAVATLERIGVRDAEVIVINDGSTDGSAQVLETLTAHEPLLRVVTHEHNRGYGGALLSGFAASTKQWVFYTDGDGQFDLAEMPPLLESIPPYDIVSCYRLNRQDPLVRKINGWCWTRLVGLLFGLRLRDIDCAFKLYRRAIFDDMPLCSTGALIDTEVLARAARQGCKIVQRGVHHYPRTAGAQTGANLRVILRAFRELFQLRRQILKGG